MECREVHYSGRVQGVGFRYTANSVAANFEVAGFVRNLSDGRVQLMVQGSPQQLDAFLNSVAQAMGQKIDGQDVKVLGPENPNHNAEFNGFEIRY